MNFNPLQTITGFFSVSSEKISEILMEVREKLPTTEILLLGKTQSGKSSIIRGLTGVSAEIVGQGFRPHTQHTQRYDYPSTDLPFITFTDTVGLGDISQDSKAIVDEISAELEQSLRARIIILTLKITDFATESLHQMLKDLRQKFPHIPCILAVTSLHEVYPPNQDHPDYPPELEEVSKPYTEIQKNFSGLYDQTVLIDFTLEEDGYTPVFYGLETLRDQICELLPQAESMAIRGQVDHLKDHQDQLGNLYGEVALRYVSTFSVMAATIAAVPLPFATMPVLTAIQTSMVVLLGKLYGKTLSPSQAGGIVTSIGGGFMAQLLGRELIKLIPGFGSAIAAAWAWAYTWALGKAACFYFGELMEGKKPDPEKIKEVMNEFFHNAQEQFKNSSKMSHPVE